MKEIIRTAESTNKLNKVCIDNVKQAIEYYTPLFGKKIFLELFVKVAKDWRSNDSNLKNFGYQS